MSAETATGRGRVLVVDDDAMVLKTVESILLLEGFSVIASNDPTETLRLMEDQDIDVAVLDIKMPRLSGLELLKVLRRTQPEVEVVMMTAFATVATALEALKGGAYDYLTKPFDSIDDLSGVVHRAVEKRRLRQASARGEALPH
jgi:two-component system, NtrC family, response regulator AtoC